MAETELTAADVASWLEHNPKFFADHPELLARIRVPHPSGTTSLIERQVAQLREDKERLERQLGHLSSIAGENEQLMRRLHGLTLALTKASDPERLLMVLDERLRADFRADAVRLLPEPGCALPDGADLVHPLPEERPQWLVRLLEHGRPECGRLTRDKRFLVFGEAGETLGSAALIPIAETGLLAIGAESDDRFHPGMGTLFLELLGETLRDRLDALTRPRDQRRRA